jgi:hypothetical protein
MASDLDYSRRNKVPRPLSDSEKARLEEFIDAIHYSARQASNLYFALWLRLRIVLTSSQDTQTMNTNTGMSNSLRIC